MGRPSKSEEEKRIKIAISLDRKLYKLVVKDGGKVSQIIEKIIKEHYEIKNM
jgi:hypothetical protein